ncbi:MAG: HAMP domain-containing histidine kinase [Candidatus Aminicenantes bacterium]|nr:HAMP domain-containing histidine kinase [Candidatus Aminicenantes bacterium]
MKSKRFFLFFYLPLIGMALIFFILSYLNRLYISNKVEELVQEQLEATAEILKVNISHLLDEAIPPERAFEAYFQEEKIYYMALLNKYKEVLAWSSRFEGYLPLSEDFTEDQGSWIIDSPAGLIFNTFSSFATRKEETYYLYLGYSLQNLEDMLFYSRRNFAFIFSLIILIGIVFFFGLFQIQKHYLVKEKETEKEKKEKERYKEISAFTSGVAHEIKNPLNSLTLIFELLQRRVPDGSKRDIEAGEKEIRKISRIIDQFSSALKPMEIKKDLIPLHSLLEEVKQMMKSKALSKGSNIEVVSKRPVKAYVDKDLFRQALINLVENALEAGSNGNVIITIDSYKNRKIIKVEDNGGGISREDREHIFDPFYSTKKDGMGIGLYLTRKIIEAHDGKISFESKPDIGTMFVIELPGG